MKTQRLTVLMDAETKAAIEARAAAAQVTISEYTRRAVEAYDPDVDLAELQALARQLGDAAERMERNLDDITKTVASFEKDLPKIRAKARAEALKEAKSLDLSLFRS